MPIRVGFQSTMLVLWICLCVSAMAQEQPAVEMDSKEFLPIKQRVLLGLRHSKMTERVAAIKSLEATPVVESAKLLVQKGLTSNEEDIRRAAYDTLLKFKEEKAIFTYLRDLVASDVKKENVTEQSTILLRVLLAAESPELRKEVDDLLLATAAVPESARPLLIRLVDGLAIDADEPSFRLLVYLTGSKIFGEDFGVRRATVLAMIKFRTKEAVSELVVLLEKAKGEVRADILRHLSAISGKKYGSHTEWKEWWEANLDTFVYPPPGGPAVAQDTATLFKNTSSYYDMPLTATRVVFVIDTSGSMRGLRIVRAQEELSRAIAALQPNTYFNVLSFDRSVDRWQSKLVEANAKNKQSAQKFVEKLQLGPMTASYDALKAAIRYDMESIYFLTDGAPRGGKIDDPVEIVKAISTENRFRRVTFNSIGIGVGTPGNVFDTFLRVLATENYGDYRRVDE